MLSSIQKQTINLLIAASVFSVTLPAAAGEEVKQVESATEQTVDQAKEEAPQQEAQAADDQNDGAQEAALAKRIAQNRSLEHYDLARYYWSRWNFKMAELEDEASIMYDCELKVAHRDYCLISLLRGHPLRAVAELMMVVGLGEPIPLTDAESLALKTKAAKLHYQEGLAYGRKNRWDKAIAEFKWALTYAPDNANIERSLAFSYASKGDFDLAEKSYSRSFNEDPTDGYSHADFAFLLADKGREDKAIAQLSEAVKLEPKVAALHVDMGWMAESKGDLSTAQTEFQQAVKLSPKHAGLWAHLGRVLERLGKQTEAESAYSQALAIDPGQDDVKQRLDSLKNRQSNEPQSPASVEHSRKQS